METVHFYKHFTWRGLVTWHLAIKSCRLINGDGIVGFLNLQNVWLLPCTCNTHYQLLAPPGARSMTALMTVCSMCQSPSQGMFWQKLNLFWSAFFKNRLFLYTIGGGELFKSVSAYNLVFFTYLGQQSFKPQNIGYLWKDIFKSYHLSAISSS